MRCLPEDRTILRYCKIFECLSPLAIPLGLLDICLRQSQCAHTFAHRRRQRSGQLQSFNLAWQLFRGRNLDHASFTQLCSAGSPAYRLSIGQQLKISFSIGAVVVERVRKRLTRCFIPAAFSAYSAATPALPPPRRRLFFAAATLSRPLELG